MTSAKSLFKQYASEFHTELVAHVGDIEPRLSREIYLDLYVDHPTRGFGNFCALLDKDPTQLRALYYGNANARFRKVVKAYGLNIDVDVPATVLGSVQEPFCSERFAPVRYSYRDQALYARPKHLDPTEPNESWVLIGAGFPSGKTPIDRRIDIELTTEAGEVYVVAVEFSNEVYMRDGAEDEAYGNVCFKRSYYTQGEYAAGDICASVDPNTQEIVRVMQVAIEFSGREFALALLDAMLDYGDITGVEHEMLYLLSEDELIAWLDSLDKGYLGDLTGGPYRRFMVHRSLDLRPEAERDRDDWDTVDDHFFTHVRYADRRPREAEGEALLPDRIWGKILPITPTIADLLDCPASIERKQERC